MSIDWPPNWLLTPNMISSICDQNGETLQILDLDGFNHGPLRSNSNFGLINLSSVQLICNKCIVLKEVNFSSSDISEESLNFLVNNLTPIIEKLNFDFVENLRDGHVQSLVKRCDKLKILGVTGIFFFQKQFFYKLDIIFT